MCDRCHNLKHHETGVPIIHPSVESLREIIFESPHKYNHIYHVMDAADFPMSILPGIHNLLNITSQRSLNRRSRREKYYQGKNTEVSFIITRSDLLAPTKDQVDSLMPYLTSVLRDCLSRTTGGSAFRLGNVRCVSAIRGWWTKELKEEVWQRGGGGWMVGKVNVGKSQLFTSVFPKGRQFKDVKVDSPMVKDLPPYPQEHQEHTESFQGDGFSGYPASLLSGEYLDYLSSGSLLPPARAETKYPLMPLVSSLPGTTASPIRVPFGSGKGELIDLPGLHRSSLENHVEPNHRPSLIMRSRVRPEQQVIKPGQSLLLGGFIRITPTTPNLIFLAYVFTPLKPHLTSTEKATAIQGQERDTFVENISLAGTGEKIKSAGKFHLRWDVTRQRTGSLTATDAGRVAIERLPFRVMAMDLLIEGVGWIEVVAQMRKPRHEALSSPARKSPQEDHKWPGESEVSKTDPDSTWPEIEVFTPEGGFVAARRPMNAWSFLRQKTEPAGRRSRKPMKGAKKLAKKRRRLSVECEGAA